MWLWISAVAAGVVVLGAVAFVLTFQYRPPQAGIAARPGSWAAVADDLSWIATGGDPDHARHSPLAQITPANVAQLAPAWTHHTGELERRGAAALRGRFQATPILAAGHLVLCTPSNRVIALDPATGAEHWVYDPQLSDATIAEVGDALNCRGVAQWTDASAPADAVCAVRILMATNDRRLIALDAGTGRPCPGFGEQGTVTIMPDKPVLDAEELHMTSAPAMVGDVMVVGSASADNQRTDAPSGMVRAFDARTGSLLWTFDLVPRRFDPVASPTWDGDAAARTGQANVWGPISVDAERDLVFLPTSSPSPDFYGGMRLGANRDANSVVALHGRSGEIVWRFLPDRASRSVGRRRAGRAEPDHAHARWPAGAGAGLRDQDRLRLRPEPRDRRAAVPGRRAQRAALGRAGRTGPSDAALLDRTAHDRAAAHRGRRGLRRRCLRPDGLPPRHRTGTPNFGGPIATSGELVFIAAATDNLLRAFDLASGAELWAGELPAGGQATPMTYAVGGRQYVVIAAGGHSVLGTKIGDAVVAFVLPDTAADQGGGRWRRPLSAHEVTAEGEGPEPPLTRTRHAVRGLAPPDRPGGRSGGGFQGSELRLHSRPGLTGRARHPRLIVGQSRAPERTDASSRRASRRSGDIGCTMPSGGGRFLSAATRRDGGSSRLDRNIGRQDREAAQIPG